MKKINLLYIHGYGGSKDGQSANLIKKYLPDKYKLFVIDYDYNADVAIPFIKSYIKENNIDVIIGTSLGGFLSLCQTSVPRLVYNPCYLPYVELPKIGVPMDIANSYAKYEKNWNIDLEERAITSAIFAVDDELLGTKYISEYQKDWNNKYILVRGGHKMTEENIRDVLFIELEKLLHNSSLLDNLNKLPHDEEI